MRVPTTIQMQLADNAAATLSTMLAYYGRHVSMDEVRSVCPASRNGTPAPVLLEAAEAFGLEGQAIELGIDELKKMRMPVVVLWKRRYYAVLKGIKGGVASVSDPAKGEYEISEARFAEIYGGLAVSLAPGPSFERGGEPERLRTLLVRRLGGLRDNLVLLLIVNLAAVLLNLAFVEGVRRILAGDHLPMLAQSPWWVPILVEAVVLLAYTAFAIRKTLIILESSRLAAAKSGASLLKHLFRLPMEFFDHVSAGELMQRMDNNAKLDRSLIQSLVPRLIDVTMTVAYLALMFSYNVYVALVCLVVELLYLAAMRRQRYAIALRSRSMVTSSGNLSAQVLNGMGIIETIKSTGAERVFFAQWHEAHDDYQASHLANQQVNAITQVISGAHNVLSSAALLFAGAYFMMQGSFDAASMVAMQMVIGRVGTSLSNCMNTLNSIQTMRTNIERVEDLRRRKTVPERALASGQEWDKLRGELEVEHVSYCYNPGDPPAVDDVSLTVRPGEVVAIVGKTGCGKSTLLKLIADLYAPSSGTIRYGGLERSEIPDVVFRSSVVTVDQEVMMFEDSIRANLKMWDSTIENYAMVLAARDAQIHDRILHEPSGYDSTMRENGGGFSGGELQRMELARALSREATLLLLDEFTSALDALTEERVMDAIRAADTTCVIVAHRLSTIRDADQIIVMDAGRIVEAGTHEELMARGGLYCDLVKTG